MVLRAVQRLEVRNLYGCGQGARVKAHHGFLGARVVGVEV